jgi:CubicO group peptidase (beta-lactamase class C family)/tetratricopeptide (TPR) repeat protein
MSLILRRFAILIALASLVAIASAAVAGDYRSGGYDAEIEQFREYVATHLPLDDVPALSIGFYKDGYIWAEGFGFADLENQVPAKAESAYRLASVTKPMTAIGVFALVEAGKIDLDAEVQEYVPYFPKKEYPVTVRLVLGHLGGISHYRDYDAEGHFKDHMDTREAIAVFEDFDLVAEPGTRYQYSSYGYNLLGAVIEGASGKPYGEYMREVLWGPFGMDATVMDDPFELIPNRVTGYQPGPDGGVIRSEFVDISSRFAAGGTRSTVIDLLKFARGLDRNNVLSAQTTDTMFTSMQTSDGHFTGYGMGWSTDPVNGRFRVGHTGGQAETRTYFAYFPSDHFAIAAAVNFEGNDEHVHYVTRLYQLLVGEPMSPEVYVGDRFDAAIFDAMDATFNFGLGYHDRYGRAFTDESGELESAFEYFNTHVDRQALDNDFDETVRVIGEGCHPAGGEALVKVGSYMAAALAKAHDDGGAYLQDTHRDGTITFFADYISLYKSKRSFSKRYRFNLALEKTVMAWKQDWDRTWNDFTRMLAVTPTTDALALARELKNHFGAAGVYPDYGEDFADLAQSHFRKDDLAAATRVATAAVDLYPLSADPHVMAGICHIALGDADKGRSSIFTAYDFDPNGAAGAGRLNGFAYRLKAFGYTEVGLELLKIALELHPDVANLYDSTGEFYLDLGDEERAIAYYEKALEVDPEFTNARNMLERIRGR